MPRLTLIKIYFAVVAFAATFPAAVLLLSSIQDGSLYGVQAASSVKAEGWGWGLTTDRTCNANRSVCNDSYPVEYHINSSGDLVIDNANPSGPGWIALSTSTSAYSSSGDAPSGLEFRETNPGAQAREKRGDLKGYVWTPTAGWISFEQADVAGCPDDPSNTNIALCKPGLEVAAGSDYIFRGWARILSVKTALELPTPNSGGYEGWIRLSSPPGAAKPYGVRVSSGRFFNSSLLGSPYAWSNEFGWLRFQGKLNISGGGGSNPFCGILANPDRVDVSKRKPTATSNLTWECGNVIAGSCTLSWDQADTTVGAGVTTINNGGSVDDADESVQTTLRKSTIYTIRCAGAGAGTSATADAKVNAVYPSGIIEVPPF